MEPRDDLVHTTRTAATVAAMIALFVTAAAPGDDTASPPPTTTYATTTSMPAATSAVATTTIVATTTTATTAAATTTTTMTTTVMQPIVVQMPPASRPVVTEADVLVARERGDLIGQVARRLGESGVRETFVRTQWYEWFYAAIAIAFGLFVARVASQAFAKVGDRAAERVDLIRAVVFHAIRGPIGLLISSVGLAIGLSFLDFTPAARLVIQTAFQLLFNVMLGWLLYNLVEVVSLVLLRVSRGRQGNLSAMLVPVVRRVLRATIIVMLALFTLNNVFQIAIPSLLAGVGIAGLAVSLAAQDTLKNLFGSVMIFADQPFLIGDLVRVDAFEGAVEDIGFRSTRIRTADGFLISIPNARVADAAVTNLSRRKATRRVVDVGLPYDATPTQVDAALSILREIVADASVAKEFDARREPASVTLDELRPGAMRVRVVYWFRATDAAAYAAHAERLNLMIVRRFAAAELRLAIVT